MYIKQQMPSLPSIKHETSFKIKTKIIIVRIVREQEKEGERERACLFKFFISRLRQSADYRG